MGDLLKRKQYKQMKKEVLDETALGVGYYDGIVQQIPDYALLEAVRKISTYGWVKLDTDDSELKNMLITESIREMNYQDFKDVSKYLFSFNRHQTEKTIRVETVNITLEEYRYFQNKLDELMSLQTILDQKYNNLDHKIDELELKQVFTGDKVIGVDMMNEQLLLLRTPENSYIDDWEVMRSHLITDYRSNDSNDKQTVRYLMDNYDELKPIIAEYILDRDLYRGFVDIDKYVIDELDALEVPDFYTQRDFYDFASTYESFESRYPTFEKYVVERYDFIYQYDQLLYLDYSSDILKDRLTDINIALDKNNKELLIHKINGYSQGDLWELSYIRDKATETIDEIDYYLEYEIGAWYKGSLTEAVVIDFNAFEQGKYTGKYVEKYYVDMELLQDNALDKIKELYPELNQMKLAESIKEQEQLKSIDKGKMI